jgi:hypothetical protein
MLIAAEVVASGIVWRVDGPGAVELTTVEKTGSVDESVFVADSGGVFTSEELRCSNTKHKRSRPIERQGSMKRFCIIRAR